MPIIKAAIKHLRQSEKHRAANRSEKDELKEVIKGFKKLSLAKKLDDARVQLPKVFSIIDKAVKNNLIHKNNAARKKSSLSKLVATK